MDAAWLQRAGARAVERVGGVGPGLEANVGGVGRPAPDHPDRMAFGAAFDRDPRGQARASDRPPRARWPACRRARPNRATRPRWPGWCARPPARARWCARHRAEVRRMPAGAATSHSVRLPPRPSGAHRYGMKAERVGKRRLARVGHRGLGDQHATGQAVTQPQLEIEGEPQLESGVGQTHGGHRLRALSPRPASRRCAPIRAAASARRRPRDPSSRRAIRSRPRPRETESDCRSVDRPARCHPGACR